MDTDGHGSGNENSENSGRNVPLAARLKSRGRREEALTMPLLSDELESRHLDSYRNKILFNGRLVFGESKLFSDHTVFIRVYLCPSVVSTA